MIIIMIGAEILITFVLAILLAFLLYWNSTKNFDYWKKRGVPYSKPVLLFGSTLDLLFKPYHEVELEKYRSFGPIYGHFEGHRASLSVSDCKLLREILVKEFAIFRNRRDLVIGNSLCDLILPIVRDENWRRLRTIVSSAFTSGKIKRMFSVFKHCADILLQNFKSVMENGDTFDAKELYGAFTLDVIARAAFSIKLDSLNDPKNELVRTIKIVFSTSFSWRFALYELFPGLMKLLKMPILAPGPMESLKALTLQIISERKKTDQIRDDLLQVLLDSVNEITHDTEESTTNSEDEDARNYYTKESPSQHIKSFSNKNVSEEEMIAQCVNFFIAGYETTASTLSHISYLLALNPEIQEKLYLELQEALGKTKGELTYETIQEMKYLDSIISETLRLYPPVTRLDRMAEADYVLGDTGITIPKGMIVTIPSYALHKDPNVYPDPEHFDPDRFTPEQRAKRDSFTYLPFGAGPRSCLGMRFALMEVKVGLVYIIANFEIQKCCQTKVPLEFHLGPGFMLAKEILLKAVPREEKIIFK